MRFRYFLFCSAYLLILSGFAQTTDSIFIKNISNEVFSFYIFTAPVSTTESIFLRPAESRKIPSTKDGLCVIFLCGVTNCPVYGFAGDSLLVAREGGRFFFSGNRSNEWNYMASLETRGYPLMGILDWDFEDVLYPNLVDQATKKKKEILDEVNRVGNLHHFSQNFLPLLKRDLECSWLRSLISYENKFYKKDSSSYASIRSVITKNLPIFEEDTLRNSWIFNLAMMECNRFLSRQYRSRTNATSYRYDELTGIDYSENLASRLSQSENLKEPARSEIRYNLIRIGVDLNLSTDEMLGPVLDNFIETTKDSILVRRVRELNGTSLKEPDPIIANLIIKELDILDSELQKPGAEVVSWKDILKDNLGKVIFVDFWASWCGPCREELKESRQFIKVTSKKNGVKFINISVDQSTLKWIEAIENLGIENDRENYRLSEESNLKSATMPNEMVPRYMIIDKKGVVRTLNAPRLSTRAGKRALEKLLLE